LPGESRLRKAPKKKELLYSSVMILENTKEQWDKKYQKEFQLQPIEETMREIVLLFKKIGVYKVLDLACGSGRHIIFLTENGFDVYGMDFSEKGIEIGRALLKARNLQAHLQVSSMFVKLPYENYYFDAIICIRALNHGAIEEIRKVIKEIERVLKPKGMLYLTVRKKILKSKRLPYKEISPRTYIPLEGDEKGIPHYMFNKKILMKEFYNFKPIKFWIVEGPKNWEAYYHFLGELKEK
jgi:ubiquinone/menaquinone biosynthesis C-methylase UbiE